MKSNLILIFILTLIPTVLWAQYDAKYLAGGVPEVNGKVVFSKELNYPSNSAQQVYDIAQAFAKQYCTKNSDSRIVYSDPQKGDIAISVSDILTFTENALFSDETRILCNIILHSESCKLNITIQGISYQYKISSDPVKYTAEEIITDKNTLSKKNTLTKLSAKFRVATIDFVNDIFAQIENQSSTTQTPTITPIETIPTAIVPTATIGFTTIELEKIPQTIIKMLPESNMIIETEKDITDKSAKWKGFGKMLGKNTASVSIAPKSKIHKGVADNETYKIEFTKDNQVWFIINCRKMGESTDSNEITLIGEVISIEVK